ncbi:MAG TPA: oxidative damage protection protein [Thermomicrobiales bacterium]|nr:oxidative damage protection protein [Thermomicrobiales bacterium]
MARVVLCKKLGRELPGLDAPPFPGDLGQRIYEGISAEAFALWQDHARSLVGAYRLNLADPAARDFLSQQMEEFFFGEQAQMPDWFGGDSPGGAGKGAKGGAPARKK